MKGILTAKIANKKKNFVLYFLYIKGLNIKMSLISVERYKNAKVHTIQVKNDLRVGIKDAGHGLGVKNISDLVLKEIQGQYEKKESTK